MRGDTKNIGQLLVNLSAPTYSLVVGDDVKHTLELIGCTEDFGSLIIKIEEGDIVEAYGLTGCVPMLTATVYQIEI